MDEQEIYRKIDEAAACLKGLTSGPSRIGVVLGSGFSGLTELLQNQVSVPYDEIPSFPQTSVFGHEGKLVFGHIEKYSIVMMQGRPHYYEGWNLMDITFPIRIMRELGVEILLLTNAAGAIRADYELGQFVLIRDHINFLGDSPLRGVNLSRYGERFPDQMEVYDPLLRQVALSVCQELGLRCSEGVYVFMSGPNYETPAEIKMLQRMGADLVGMSTVPEAVVAHHQRCRVLGLSCVANYAAGLGAFLKHEELVGAVRQLKGVDHFLREWLKRLAERKII